MPSPSDSHVSRSYSSGVAGTSGYTQLSDTGVGILPQVIKL